MEPVGGDDRITRLVAFLSAILVATFLLTPTAVSLPARAQSPAVDQSQNDAAQRWTDEVLGIVQPNAVIVSWWSYSTPLWYATIVDHRRPDITIVDDRNRLDQNLGDLNQVIARFLPTHPVYLIRNGTSEIPAVVERYAVEPVGKTYAGNLLQVHPLMTGSGR
jgi:hypothetical protein